MPLIPGRRDALAIAASIWASLKTLQLHTITTYSSRAIQRRVSAPNSRIALSIAATRAMDDHAAIATSTSCANFSRARSGIPCARSPSRV